MGNLNILISRASIAGPTLAYFLVLSSAHVTIIERNLSFRSGGQGVDIWGSGRSVVGAMGCSKPQRHEARMRAADESGEQSSSSDFEILHGELAGLLYEKTRHMDGVNYVFGDTVESVEQEGGKVRGFFSEGCEGGGSWFGSCGECAWV